MPPIEFRPSPWRTLLYLLGSATFVAIGVWMMFEGKGDLGPRIGGAICVAFFGFGAALFLRQLVSPRQSIRFDEQGIHVRQAVRANDFDLRWDQVAGVRVWAMGRQKVVVLDPKDERMGLDGVSPLLSRLRDANISIAGSWMTIPAMPFGTTVERLVGEISQRHAAHLRSFPGGTPLREFYAGDLTETSEANG